MYYVYILKSQTYPDRTYVGQTKNVAERLYVHNTGGSPHTAKYKPWSLVSAISFGEQDKAIKFEKYLKSGSGRAFIKKRLLD